MGVGVAALSLPKELPLLPTCYQRAGKPLLHNACSVSRLGSSPIVSTTVAFVAFT